jgi:hypothetical protein
MVIDALKIVHLGTPDSETGLTDIAKGLKEIFENGADVVYVQSAEISELFAETREIMRLMYNSKQKNLDNMQYYKKLNYDTTQQIKTIFYKCGKKSIDLSNVKFNQLDQHELNSFKYLFWKFVNFTPNNDYPIKRVDFLISVKSEDSILHVHDNEFRRKMAEILFAVSENPALTTRIVPEYSTADRIPENFSRCSTVSAPQDAIILMRNGGVKPNPIHGPPEKPSNRFTFLATVSPA